MSVRKCESCGAGLAPAMEQCLRCGHSETWAGSPPVVTSMGTTDEGDGCPTCGAALVADVDWCGRCLTRIPAGVAVGAAVQSPAPPWGSSPAPWKTQPAYGSWEEEPQRRVRYATWFSRVCALLVDQVLLVVVIVPALLLGPLGVLVAAPFALWNYLIRPGRTGQSLGRTAMGISVVDAVDHKPIGVWRFFCRSLAHIFDGLPMYLGYLWPLFDKHNRTFADMLARTVVIR